MNRSLMGLKILFVMTAVFLSHSLHSAEPSEDTLAGAFLANCKHTQACQMEALSANPETDQALVQMIQSRMAGQCEAQLAKISQYEGAPHAQGMALCFRTMSQMSCEELRGDPDVPECNTPND